VSILITLAAVALTEAANEATGIAGLGVVAQIALAATLLAAGAGLVALEFLLVSGGLIAAAALGCFVAAIVIAFMAGEAAGYAFLLGAPLVALLAARVGLRWMGRSNMVVHAEVTADAGYRHVADAVGAVVGAEGTLVTPAFPTGRARFAGGEIDVLVRGATLASGARIVVIAIDGPTVVVGPVSPPPPSSVP